MENQQEIIQEEMMMEGMIQGQGQDELIITSKDNQDFIEIDDEAMAIGYLHEDILALEPMNEQAIFQAATFDVTELQGHQHQHQQQQLQQQARQERQVTELDMLLKPSLDRIQQVIPELSDQNALDLLIAAKLDPEEALRNFFV